ncbi:Phospholipid ABC transporter permease protein MlaE [hydrothermal vent metagenome]|uniref:Phospholipid ABC transporter permease protein MlaE n=1 Tax=hydrothermal vent metagenome TaxID=652676 RepID=A0A3B0QNJ9_9ZZZZ
MIANSITLLGRGGLSSVLVLGRSGVFLVLSLYYSVRPPIRMARIAEELEFIGTKSCLIIFVTALFTGMVLALQGYYTLSKFGSEALLGTAVALSIVRELGPVLCALMVAGRAGSAITAEIGIMKITDQLPALEMMAIDPIEYVISPKIIVSIIALPLLTAFFDLVAILGGYIVGVLLLGVNEGSYFGDMVKAMTLHDIYSGFIKALAFGLLIAWICTFIGYTAKPTTEGVSSATTNAVVLSSVSILIVDYILTSILF